MKMQVSGMKLNVIVITQKERERLERRADKPRL
jgi:hypothetical protein